MWPGHFKQRNERLVALLGAGLVVCHFFVVVELACVWTMDKRLAAVAAELGLAYRPALAA